MDLPIFIRLIRKKNENIIGRIPVPTKGTEKVDLDLSKEKISYPDKISYLRNYLNDGGW